MTEEGQQQFGKFLVMMSCERISGRIDYLQYQSMIMIIWSLEPFYVVLTRCFSMKCFFPCIEIHQGMVKKKKKKYPLS